MRTSTLALILTVMLALSQIVNGQQINTYVDRDSVEAGGIFNYIIVVEGDYDSLQYPGEDAFGEDIEVVSRQRFQLSSSRDSLVYELQFFGVEDHMIDRQQISLHRGTADTTLFTNRVPLAFKSSLAEGDAEFRPLKPIFDFARSYWLHLIILLLLAFLSWYLYKNYKQRQTVSEPPSPPVQPEPFVNPLRQLRKKIKELPEITSLQKREDFETFYVELGDAIRLYLKRVYEFPALEMTTREINQALQKEMASSKIITITRKVLNEADIVKFANFQPGQEQAQKALRTAEEFVHTADETDHERIGYLKYQYDQKHGLLQNQNQEEQ